MKLNELSPKAGSTKNRMRVGRGIGSGKGKTSGSGQKGQKSRSGVAIKGFEGGQMPIDMRLPKFGFSNVKFGTKYAELTIDRLQEAVDMKITDGKKALDEDALVKLGIVRRKRDGIKIIGNGELKVKLDLTVSKITKGAQAVIEKAGGKVTLIEKNVAPIKNPGRDKREAAMKAAEKKA